jgi:hypothetical protein
VNALGEGTRDDVASWLEIVREVEPLFGPMPDFESTLRRNIGRGTALCVALRRYPPPCEVLVDSFGEDSIEGNAARRLYESFGFLPGEDLPDGAEGGSRQRFRLARW